MRALKFITARSTTLFLPVPLITHRPAFVLHRQVERDAQQRRYKLQKSPVVDSIPGKEISGDGSRGRARPNFAFVRGSRRQSKQSPGPLHLINFPMRGTGQAAAESGKSVSSDKLDPLVRARAPVYVCICRIWTIEKPQKFRGA